MGAHYLETGIGLWVVTNFIVDHMFSIYFTIIIIIFPSFFDAVKLPLS